MQLPRGMAGLIAPGMLACLSAPAMAGWTASGPFGVAEPSSLAWDPTDPKTLYAGAINGVFVSRDLGATWTEWPIPTGPGLANSIAPLMIDPGTGAVEVSAGGPLLRTSKLGTAWAPVLTGPSQPGGFVADPAMPREFIAYYQNELYRSVSGGAVWTQLNPSKGTSFPDFVSLAVDPQTPLTLYAAGSQQTLLKSINGGRSFSPVLTLTCCSSYIPLVAAGSAGAVYAVVDTNISGTPGSTSTIIRSANGGSSWSASAGLATNAYLTTLAADATNPSVLYAGGPLGSDPCALYRSQNGGQSWQCRLPATILLGTSLIATRPSGGVAISAGDGIHVSLDSGKSWSRVAGTGFTQPTADGFVANPTSGEWFVTAGGFLYRSTDRGVAWGDFTAGLQAAALAAKAGPIDSIGLSIDAAASPAALYASAAGRLWVSRDSGKSFTLLSPAVSGQTVQILSVTTDPRTAGRIWLGYLLGSYPAETSGFLRSDDYGQSWVAASLPTTQLFNPYTGVSTIILPDPNRAGSILAIAPGGLYASANLGKTWSLLFSDPDLYGLVITTGAQPAYYLYGNYTPSPYELPEPFMVRSSDRGASWTTVSPPNGDLILSVMALPGGSTLVAQAGIGLADRVFTSADGGATWQDITENLPPSMATDAAALWTTPDTLVAGLPYQGLYTQPSAALPRK